MLLRVGGGGATGAAFSNFELTKGELAATKKLRARYWIYLISGCLGVRPKLHRIQDPQAFFGNWRAGDRAFGVARLAAINAVVRVPLARL